MTTNEVINRLVPWAIYDHAGKLHFLTMATKTDDVWEAFAAYVPGASREVYRDQGYECVRVSVKRL